MLGLIGKKIGMTQLFDEFGILAPVTVLGFGENFVVRRRSMILDGYDAVVLGSVDLNPKRVTLPFKGQFPMGVSPKRIVRELRGFFDLSVFAVGKVLGVDVLMGVRFVDVVGVCKGKGFSGSMKKHGFKGGRETHGSKFHRGLGSTGQSSTPSNTKRGRKMAGRAGSSRVTTQNLEVVRVDMELGLVIVKGAVPGVNNSFIVVREAVKRKG